MAVMATESIISFPTTPLPLFDNNNIINAEAAEVASQLLQENHNVHHIFTSPEGFHNHIVHHVTTLLALGATPAVIQQHYRSNKVYQRPIPDVSQGVIEPTELKNPQKFMQHLGRSDCYASYLRFFEREIKASGIQPVIRHYLLNGGTMADDMLERLFIFHPLIHLGCGLEFEQPALVAEALALTAVHVKRISGYYLPVETAAQKFNDDADDANDKSLVSIIEEIRRDQKLQMALSWEESRKYEKSPVHTEILTMTHYASQWRVNPNQVEEKLAEIFNITAFAAAAAQRPPKIVKLDFFLIHGLTTAHGLAVLLRQPWIPIETKARLVEWMGRLVLAAYLTFGAPAFYIDEITEYRPKEDGDKKDPWAGLIKRAVHVNDDGHTSKFVRALIQGRDLCASYESNDRFLVKGDMWLKICHMCLDSVERSANGEEARWVRFCGFQEAWQDIPIRAK